MAFTGHKTGESLFVQRVGMAVSDDLVRWEKLPQNPTSEADPAHYELVSTGQRTLTHWRDPFLLDTGDEVSSTSAPGAPAATQPPEVPSALPARPTCAAGRPCRPWSTNPIAEEMEVPQVYAIDGRHYLVFCTKDFWLSPSYKSRFPGHAFRSTDYSMVGDSPLGPFRLHGTGEIMAEASPSSWYASQLVCYEGEWFLLSTVTDDVDRTSISDPLPVTVDETGLHADM